MLTAQLVRGVVSTLLTKDFFLQNKGAVKKVTASKGELPCWHIYQAAYGPPAQTLVNTVNVVGVMGKGITSELKRKYPVD